jgi:hypothetical protein
MAILQRSMLRMVTTTAACLGVAGSSFAMEGAPGAAPLPPAPVVTWTHFEQLIAFVAGGLIKPLYMLLAVVVLVVLYRGPSSAPLRLLRHGMLWFLIGELFCALNFLHHPTGPVMPLDLLHGVGMVAMSTLIPWGLFRLVDDRVLRFTDPSTRCLAQHFCKHCWKRDPVRCGPHDLMGVVVCSLAALSLMPLSSPLRPIVFTVDVLGTRVDYGQPIVNHLVELRLYPILAAMAFLVTLVLLRGGPSSTRRAEPVFFAGFGLMSYSLLRSLLLNTFRENLYWSDFWEELTELAMVLFIGFVLVFLRRPLGLFRDKTGEPNAVTPVAARDTEA